MQSNRSERIDPYGLSDERIPIHNVSVMMRREALLHQTQRGRDRPEGLSIRPSHNLPRRRSRTPTHAAADVMDTLRRHRIDGVSKRLMADVADLTEESSSS